MQDRGPQPLSRLRVTLMRHCHCDPMPCTLAAHKHYPSFVPMLGLAMASPRYRAQEQVGMLPLAVLTRMLFLEELRLWLPSSSENAADSGFLSFQLGALRNPLPAPMNNCVNDDGAVWRVPRLAKQSLSWQQECGTESLIQD